MPSPTPPSSQTRRTPGAFTRVANRRKRGLGGTSLLWVLSARRHDGRAGVGRRGGTGERARARGRRRAGRSGASCRRWCACASGCGRSAPVGDLLEELLRETGYFDALEAKRTIEAQGRLENLEELVRVGARVDAMAEQGSVGEFLQQIAPIADVDSLRDDEGLADADDAGTTPRASSS